MQFQSKMSRAESRANLKKSVIRAAHPSANNVKPSLFVFGKILSKSPYEFCDTSGIAEQQHTGTVACRAGVHGGRRGELLQTQRMVGGSPRFWRVCAAESACLLGIGSMTCRAVAGTCRSEEKRQALLEAGTVASAYIYDPDCDALLRRVAYCGCKTPVSSTSLHGPLLP
jgi:hypothetical protein